VRIVVPKESRAGETRVAATPKTVEALRALGYEVAVETRAGLRASFDDESYAAAGAEIVEPGEAFAGDGLVAASRRLAMDAVPRISRAQSLDVLSSMANIGGLPRRDRGGQRVRVVLHRAGHGGRQGPAGEGARRRGRGRRAGGHRHRQQPRGDRAGVRRPPEVAEQVESMGGSSCGSTSRTPGPSRRLRQGDGRGLQPQGRRTLCRAGQADVDIIITTALIPGKPAPRLLTEEMVASMKPGSVVVDMAAANGGNVAGSAADERVVTDNGVTILGYTDLPGRLPTQASQLFGTNLVNLMKLLTTGEGRRVRPESRRRGAARDDRDRTAARCSGRRRRSRCRPPRRRPPRRLRPR
jgi:NAD(P) transhydrogenase subunit alpha